MFKSSEYLGRAVLWYWTKMRKLAVSLLASEFYITMLNVLCFWRLMLFLTLYNA